MSEPTNEELADWLDREADLFYKAALHPEHAVAKKLRLAAQRLRSDDRAITLCLLDIALAINAVCGFDVGTSSDNRLMATEAITSLKSAKDKLLEAGR